MGKIGLSQFAQAFKHGLRWMSTIQKIESGAKKVDELTALIRDPDSAGPVGRAIGIAGRRFCDAFSNAEVLRGDEPGAQLPLVGLARIAANVVCTPYLEDGGNTGPQIGSPPFIGGQCAGVAYTVNFQDFDNGQPFGGPRTTAGVGPVSIRTTVEGNVQRTFIVFQNSEFQTISGNVASNPISVITSVARQDGMADNCGNLPGDFEPGGNPRPSPGPFPPGEEPDVDPTGQPFFFVPPIQTPFGEYPIPDDYFGGDGGISPGSGDGLPGLPDAIAPSAGGVTGGEDGEEVDFGAPPDGRVWVGCLVQLDADPRIGNIPGTGPGNTVWPTVLGNAALRYGSLSGSNVRLSARYSELFRPVNSLVVTGCFLQTQIGANATVFPISAESCPANPCEGN